MPYTSDDTLTQNGTFQGRIRMAMVNAAIKILAETPNPRLNLERKRQTLAIEVLQNPTQFQNSFVHASIEANNLTSSSLDSDIDVAIASIWNDLAGVIFSD